MTLRAAFAAAALVAFLPTASVADPAAFAPPNVVHAVWLQTQGTLADEAVVEPCSTDGVNDAVSHTKAAVENSDALTLSTQVFGFSVGFARCALAATNAAEFARFAAVSANLGAMHLEGQLSLGQYRSALQAKAEQYATISRWVSSASSAPSDAKDVADQTIVSLKNLGFKVASLESAPASSASIQPMFASLPLSKTPLRAIRLAFERDVLSHGVTVVSMIEANDTIMAAIVMGESGSSVVLKRYAGGWKVVGSTGGAIDAVHAARYGLTPQDVKTFSGLAGGIVGIGQRTAFTRPTPASVRVLISSNHPMTLIQQAR